MLILRDKILIIAVLLLACFLSPVSAWQDGTHLFEEETKWLADNFEKETRTEYQLRTKGFVQFADTKPPEVGDVETFTTYNVLKNRPEKIQAFLKKIGRHCYVFVEAGKKVSNTNLEKIKNEFDKNIYPETRDMFGSEWSPGIDGDERITLLLLDIKDSYNPDNGQKGFTAGYFYAGDEYSRAKNPKSNEREMLYLDICPGNPGTKKFFSVIAHEFQHMIHWNHDPKEFTWVNESLSQLAPYLCGYGHAPQLKTFLKEPDNNLCAWSQDSMLANYGQVYLWAYYISKHISSTEPRRRAFVKRMIKQKSQGLSGLNAAIKKQRIKTNAAKLFRNFCVANHLNDSRISGGDYGYDKQLSRLRLRPQMRLSKIPGRGKSSVKCWSSKGIIITDQSIRGEEIEIHFAGEKISSGRYKNNFDLAFLSWSSARKSESMVEWIRVTKFTAKTTLTVPKDHDKMMLLVINRGPDTMKIEQAYAKGAGPADFVFSIARADSRQSYEVSLAQYEAYERQNFDEASALKILRQIAEAPSIGSYDDEVLSSKDEASTAEDVEAELVLKRLLKNEEKFMKNFRLQAENKNSALLKVFNDFYQSADEENKLKLNSIREKMMNIQKFEELQGTNGF
ncbi:MAG: hypothetical protein ACQETH_08565 [Candidatus Rifleibacteriota bacterium]